MEPTTADYTEAMAAQAAAVFFGHRHPGSAAAFRDALNVFAPLVSDMEREACAKICDAEYSAIDDDADDYAGKDRWSEAWKQCSTRIGMKIKKRTTIVQDRKSGPCPSD